MQILINGNTVTFPTTLSEFTLGQKIDFYNQYGRELDAMLQSILEMDEGLDKELELTEFQFEKMIRTFAFFAGCTPEAVKDSEFIDDVANIYLSSIAVLFEEEQGIPLQSEFVWKGEVWQLHTPKLKQSSKMQFGELIDAKQTVKDMAEMSKGKWEYMLPLAAIFLRKEGEEYQESFMYEGSERLELMKDLPMDIALQVGFFLTSSMNMFINSSQSFNPQEQKVLANTQKRISIVGGG